MTALAAELLQAEVADRLKPTNPTITRRLFQKWPF
jgi:hypothetical protein